jgi:branched-subunit amino acid ABC-type transport system permease component
MRAVADDEEIAAAMGVRVSRVWIVTFIAAGALAGVTGVFIGMVTQAVDVTMGPQYLLLGFAAVVIGGLGNIRGAVIGALIVGGVKVFGIAAVSSSFAEGLTYAVLFAFIAWRPNGLFGTKVERA